jgi:hypothetical protein
LHNEEEMEKSDFIATGWPLIKPFVMKAQGLENPSQPDQQTGEIPLPDDHQQDESMPEVNLQTKVLLSIKLTVKMLHRLREKKKKTRNTKKKQNR